ncbi:HigA family addiction module antidote protein [Pediococcus pentosaceus]|uniref:HigA family addiction module antitoxin n=1 Tax=Pediococcus pentosaceus TaxID=1255 RepID=UPI001962E591|nr:HigA family addiction module antidote protein [Pediococcus pentosaceus]
MMSKEVTYKDLIAFHPGSYVEDVIDDLNITQEEFAKRLDTTPKTLSKVVNGEARISKDIANKLFKITGVSVETWLNLQAKYDAKIVEIENQQNQDEQDICRNIDFKYFKDNGFFNPNKRYKLQDKISALRNLLNVSNLSQLIKFNSLVSYRHTQKFSEKSVVNSNVMLELAMNEARNRTSNKYQKVELEAILPDIRKMTLQTPEQFYTKLKNMLLNCGIVLVGLPKLTSAGLNGATKKFKNGSVLLLITDKDKKADVFWFSLIHELGHIYYEDFTSDSNDQEEYRKKEERADKFARNFFIPENLYDEFVRNNHFDEDAVKDFSEKLGISSGIVVGRLQREKKIDYKELNNLKLRYVIELS